MNSVGLILGFLTVAGFALSMKPHHQAILNRPLKDREKRCYQFAGVIAALVTFIYSVKTHGWDFGLTGAVIDLTIGGLLLTFLISYQPRAVVWLSGIGMAGLLCLLALPR
jgi:hypothetical protein